MSPKQYPATRINFIRYVSSSSPLEFVTLAAIVVFNVVGQFGERTFNRLDEAETAGGASAKAYDSIAFGEIVGYGENFTIIGEAIGCAFNHFVSGLAGFRV